MAQPTETSGAASEATPAEGELKRGLSARHMQMIAIGGAIGTGLFVASGKTISTAGPGGAILAYALIGIMVLFLMQSLGEMAAHLPVPGAFQTYAARYVSPSFGFAMGWNYWFNWAITVAAELVAVGEVMRYWFPDIPSWVWAAGFLVLLTGINALSARSYGESEFWLATIKVVTVIVFLIAGIAMIFGILGGSSPGVSNWTVGEVMRYWFPDIPSWVWAAGFLVLLTGINALSARSYGESEFWLATIKVVTVVVFLIAGIAMIFGILGGSSPGVSNWTVGEAPFVGGAPAVLAIFMVAGFSFQGTEMIGVAAGESENPRRDVPRALTSVFWRIMLFYIGAMAVIGFLIPYSDPNLLTAADGNINISPFTLIFERAGIAFAAAIMNAVILSAVLSAGNSGLYVSARMLFALAQEGKAPKMFTHINSGGVPMNALLATAAIGAVGFIAALLSPDGAYLWLVNVSGLAGFITWVGIAVAHYRFRRAYLKQGNSLKDLPYVAPFFPAGPIIAFLMCLVVIGGQNYEAFLSGDWAGVLSSYIGLPVIIAVWLVHRVVTRDRIIPLEQIDVSGIEVKASK